MLGNLQDIIFCEKEMNASSYLESGLPKIENQHWKNTLNVPDRASATELHNVFSPSFVAKTFFVCLFETSWTAFKNPTFSSLES